MHSFLYTAAAGVITLGIGELCSCIKVCTKRKLQKSGTKKQVGK